MDLPFIECLESALSDYGGGLLLVSHDERFLSMLTDMLWEIKPGPHSENDVVIHISQRGLGQGNPVEKHSAVE